MSFAVTAEAYRRFMGRFSEPLADRFAAAAGIVPGMRVLDVGSGPGALTRVLAEVVGADRVSAVDPMPAFVDALRERLPGVDAAVCGAEHLPHDDATFEATLANLVVPFMTDPLAGLRAMARVTRPGGVVGATVWQHSTGTSPLTPFWDGVRLLDPDAIDEADQVGTREGALAALFAEAGLAENMTIALPIAVDFGSFDDWWAPFTYGVGPAGGYLAAQTAGRRAAIRDACAATLGPAPFTVTGAAWCVVATR